MGIKIEIPVVLQQNANGRKSVEVTGNTVHECLEDLVQQYPEFKGLFEPNNPVAWISLNEVLVSLKEQNKPVTEYDRLALILMLGGG